VNCQSCGQALPEQARFCQECGAAAVPEEPAKSTEGTASAGKTPAKDPDEITRFLELPEEKGRFDRTAPPVVSPLTIFFAIIGLVLILILLNPWHAGQDKPADFQGSRGASPTVVAPQSSVR